MVRQNNSAKEVQLTLFQEGREPSTTLSPDAQKYLSAYMRTENVNINDLASSLAKARRHEIILEKDCRDAIDLLTTKKTNKGLQVITGLSITLWGAAAFHVPILYAKEIPIEKVDFLATIIVLVLTTTILSSILFRDSFSRLFFTQ